VVDRKVTVLRSTEGPSNSYLLGPSPLSGYTRGVQTFLPYASFEQSARSLDPKRLGKQRVECIQVLRGLTVEGYGWRHHPAVKMWKGYEEALGRYAFTCCEVWLESGFGDTCAATIGTELASIGIDEVRTQAELADAGALPPWLGDEDFHRSHRSSLLRKDPEFYGSRFTDVPDDLPYVWPVPAPGEDRSGDRATG
jgi:hypothetical protein